MFALEFSSASGSHGSSRHALTTFAATLACAMAQQISHFVRPWSRSDVVVFHPPPEFNKYSSRNIKDEARHPSQTCQSLSIRRCYWRSSHVPSLIFRLCYFAVCCGPAMQALIKRIIAVAGDKAQVKDGALFINGVRQEEDYVFEEPGSSLQSSTSAHVHCSSFLRLNDHTGSLLPQSDCYCVCTILYCFCSALLSRV